MRGLLSARPEQPLSEVDDPWKPDPGDPFWMLEVRYGDDKGAWCKSLDTHLTTRSAEKALRFPNSFAADVARKRIFPDDMKFEPTEHLWINHKPHEQPPSEAIFDLLEGIAGQWEKAGDRDCASALRAGFSRNTGGIDVPFLVKQLATEQPPSDGLAADQMEAACDAFMSRIVVDGNGGLEFLEEALTDALTALSRPHETTVERVARALFLHEGNRAELWDKSDTELGPAWAHEVRTKLRPKFMARAGAALSALRDPGAE